MPHTQQISETFSDLDSDLDMSFLDDIDAFIDDQMADHQEVVVEDDEDLLISAINDTESEEEMAELYNSQEVVVDTAEIVEVSGEGVPILEAAASVALAEKELVKVANTHKSRASKPSHRISAKLGVEVIDYTTLSSDWAMKDSATHLADFEKIVDSMALYVSDKAVNLFTYLKTGGGLNAVTQRGFEVLLRDGQLVGSDSGNIIQNLLSKPYSIGTARSQGSQLIQLFDDLEIGKRTARGVVVANSDSIILERVKLLLGK